MIAGYEIRRRLNKGIEMLLTCYMPLGDNTDVSGYRASVILMNIARVYMHGGEINRDGPRATYVNILIHGMDNAIYQGTMTEKERAWFMAQAYDYIESNIDPVWAGENFATQVNNAGITIQILTDNLSMYGYKELATT